MKNELNRLPRASEPKMEKTQIELARKTWDLGNQRFGNLVEALTIKQKPNEQRNVPKQKK